MFLVAAAAIAIGVPEAATVDRVHLAVDGARGTALLTLSMSSPQLFDHVAVTPIELPRGVRVVGMSITTASEMLVATPIARAMGPEQFRAVVEYKVDPALLELTERTKDRDRLALHVYPIGYASPVRVELALALPTLDALTIAVDAPVAIELDGEEIDGTRVTLPQQHGLPRARGASVSATTSLLAAERPPRRPTVIVDRFFACGVGVERSISKTEIRRRVKLAQPRLRRCYMQQAQRDRTLEGTANLTFEIGHEGRARAISVDGTLANEDVQMCIANEVASWSFAPTDVVTRVNYPLTFRLATKS